MNIQCFFSISKHITLIGKPFINQTKRTLRIRREEDMNNIKINYEYHNVISKHLVEPTHDPDNRFLNGIKLKSHIMI